MTNKQKKEFITHCLKARRTMNKPTALMTGKRTIDEKFGNWETLTNCLTKDFYYSNREINYIKGN